MTKSFVFEYMTGFVQIKLLDTTDNDDGALFNMLAFKCGLFIYHQFQSTIQESKATDT